MFFLVTSHVYTFQLHEPVFMLKVQVNGIYYLMPLPEY